MLTEHDIDLIAESRREVYANRTHKITLLIPQEDGKHPISGEPIKVDPLEHECDAIVTEISTNVNVDRYLENGILVEKGDVLFHVDYTELPSENAEFTEVSYRGEDYEVINAANKGLGRLNRVELLGRLIT